MSSRVLRRALAAALLLGTGLGGYAWWAGGGKRLFFPRKWGVVEAGWIYRSGQIHERLIEATLRDHGIDLVIDLARDDPRRGADRAERAAAERLGIERLELPGLDGYGRGDPGIYVAAVSELVRARRDGRQVLVHCAAGSERTGAAVALYRMLFEGWSGERAYAEYLSYRSRPPSQPRLAEYLNRHMPEIADALVAAALLPQAPRPLPVFGPGEAAR